EGALAMLLQKRTRARPLGALLAQDLVLLRGELRAPLGVGLLDLEFLGGIRRRCSQPAEGGKAKQAGQRGEQDAAGTQPLSPYSGALSDTVQHGRSYIEIWEIVSLSCEAERRSGALPALTGRRGRLRWRRSRWRRTYWTGTAGRRSPRGRRARGRLAVGL